MLTFPLPLSSQNFVTNLHPNSHSLYSRTPEIPEHMSWHPRITFYRLTVILSTIWLGTAKAVYTYQGREFISITIDWIMGVVIYLLQVPTTNFSILQLKLTFL